MRFELKLPPGGKKMLTLTEYLARHRTESAPKTEDVFPGEIYRSTRALYYDVPANDKTYRVFAYLTLPQRKPPRGGFPAVVILHGGNGMAYYEVTKMWADRGFAAIAPDLNGKCAVSTAERNVVNPDGGPEGYGTNVRGEHPWAFFGVLSAMRAVDVLAALPEVNAQKICSCGLSWGGYLNLLFAAKERRLKAASIIYSSAFTDESSWGKNNTESFSEQEKRGYAEKTEPKNYLPEITAPVFFTAGADDHAFSMENRRRTAAALRAPACFSLRRSFPHANIYGFEEPESAVFCKEVLAGRLPCTLSAAREGLALRAVGAKAGSALSLVFTRGDAAALPPPEWEELPMPQGTAALPAGCTAYFIAERRRGGTQWSSPLYLA